MAHILIRTQVRCCRCLLAAHNEGDAPLETIEIDLDVSKAIEARRLSADESPNQILRRLLGINLRSSDAGAGPMPRTSRSSGAYSTTLGSVTIEANSLKELLRRTILLCEKSQPGFIGRLARQPTRRGRYLVAKSAAGLYPKSPQLAAFGERLNSAWWYDTNVSRTQVLAHLRQFAEVLQFSTLPTLHKRSERTTLTLADLGLA